MTDSGALARIGHAAEVGLTAAHRLPTARADIVEGAGLILSTHVEAVSIRITNHLRLTILKIIIIIKTPNMLPKRDRVEQQKPVEMALHQMTRNIAASTIVHPPGHVPSTMIGKRTSLTKQMELLRVRQVQAHQSLSRLPRR